MACHSASIADGLPPTIFIEAFQPDWAELDANVTDPNQLALRTKLFHIQTTALCKIVPHFMASSDDSTLEALIELFDSQTRMLQPQLRSGLDVLTMYCVRLHVCVSRCMLADHYRYLSGMIELYGIAINVIEKFAELDADTDYAHYASFYHTRTLLLAAYVVLKLHRTPPELSIDRGLGESCYFKVIALLRKKSLHSTFEADLDLKAAVLLTQLWSSTTVFRNAQGHTDSLSVRIRSRMSMNVFFDCAWWWRQEFREEPDPFATATQAMDIDQLANFPDFVYDGNYFGLYGDALSMPVSHGWT
ncbi:uncharacterized protein AB675_7199 [Cyphellophora attinorum]|uniref:Transcription factor domain-containing protein n=1 Tax=Cyphellophora attinorum TaxID=1664694 RepID=A0A0N1NWC6_9EURO|nr:uncharacterized protein AB675_7199 [Phialophora attinorum]KPI35057.1 hypothetical protein AB675_7199 [Phialophora attinorum]